MSILLEECARHFLAIDWKMNLKKFIFRKENYMKYTVKMTKRERLLAHRCCYDIQDWLYRCAG